MTTFLWWKALFLFPFLFWIETIPEFGKEPRLQRQMQRHAASQRLYLEGAYELCAPEIGDFVSTANQTNDSNLGTNKHFSVYFLWNTEFSSAPSLFSIETTVRGTFFSASCPTLGSCLSQGHTLRVPTKALIRSLSPS